MSLSAKERILRLREAEFKLNKLQSDLLSAERNGDTATVTFMSKFLEHHKELMSMPGATRNSIPSRIGHDAPKRYIEAQKPARLTLPPKLDNMSAIAKRLKHFREPDVNSTQGAYGKRHPSLALQSLINELEDQTEKMATAFPKLDRMGLINHAPYLRSIQPLNSMRYVGQDLSKKQSNKTTAAAYKAFSNARMKSVKPKSTAILFSKTAKVPENRPSTQDSKTKLENQQNENNNNNVSLSVSKSDVSMEFFKKDLKVPVKYFPKSKNDESRLDNENDDDLKNTDQIAYAIESSNMMAVFLPRGPKSWTVKPTQSRALPVQKKPSDTDEKIMTAKDALQLLRRRDRELPERNTIVKAAPQPHQRGLVGVEISQFEPSCAFFYRDRNGNYNPHLQFPDSDASEIKPKRRVTKSLLQHP